MDYWITTHWPVPENDDQFGRHVYVKDAYKTYPAPGDVVFVRESISVKGQSSPTVDRCYGGREERVRLQGGFGGLIGRMVVTGPHRDITRADVVYNYGDLPEWSLIQCRGFKRFRLPLNELMSVIGKRDSTNVRFLRLWRVPDKHVPRLLDAVGRQTL